MMQEFDFYAICELIAEGASVRQACTSAGFDGKTAQFWAFMDADPTGRYRARYMQAREYGAHTQFDELLDVENSVLAGTTDPRALTAVLASRRYRLARLVPQSYGEVLRFSTESNATEDARKALERLTDDELRMLAASSEGRA
jgi:hypothetical protein